MIIERTTVHVSDDTGRVAMLEKRMVGNEGDDHGTAEELTRYIYSNHLQSASLELDEAGEVISYEEYHPYGTTSYQAMNASIHAVAKRYRYTGKERDEEGGLYYHGARYYIPWLCRWASCDPINSENYNLQKGYGLEKNKERDFLELTASPYEYSYDNPVNYNDETGEQPNNKKPINTPKSAPPIDPVLEGSPKYQKSQSEKPKIKPPSNKDNWSKDDKGNLIAGKGDSAGSLASNLGISQESAEKFLAGQGY